jgi:hypothetical protein
LPDLLRFAALAASPRALSARTSGFHPKKRSTRFVRNRGHDVRVPARIRLVESLSTMPGPSAYRTPVIVFCAFCVAAMAGRRSFSIERRVRASVDQR